MNNDLMDFFQKELEDFLRPHFESSDALADYLSDVFDYENGSIVKRQMLFQTKRFVSLANNIEKIVPFCDGLRLLFLKICLESLHSLSNCKNNFYGVFCESFSAEGKAYILDHFKLLQFTDEYRGDTVYINHAINLSDFLFIIKIIRDRIAHDGELWSLRFFAYGEDSTWFTEIETDEEMIKSYKYRRESKKITTYYFKTTLNYERFIFYFVEACINYITQVNENRTRET
ncbi:MAG: hypothetical protein J1E60_06865 [Christensenellaceae bacterium]|nr:hypothetical protein [Christensenellaceae bacterium]